MYKLRELDSFWQAYKNPSGVPSQLFDVYTFSDLTPLIAAHRAWLMQEQQLVQQLKNLFEAGRFAELDNLLSQLRDARVPEGED